MTRPVLAQRPRLRRAMFRAAFVGLPLLPILAGRVLAWLGSWAVWWLDANGRRVIAHNLTPLAGHRGPPTNAAIRRTYLSFLLAAVDSLHLHRFTGARLRPPRLTIVDPWGVAAQGPYTDAAVWCSVHVNFELCGALLVRAGILKRLDAIALSNGDEAIDRFFQRVRAASGVRTLMFERAPLASLRSISSGLGVGIVGDRDYTNSGRVVPVANGYLRLPPGPAALPVQTGCPVIPLLLARRGWKAYTLVIGKPLYASGAGTRREQVADLLTELGQWYGRLLQAVPTQWVAFHPAWAEPPTT